MGDFQHFKSLVERAVFVVDRGDGGRNHLATLLQRLRDTIAAAQYNRWNGKNANRMEEVETPLDLRSFDVTESGTPIPGDGWRSPPLELTTPEWEGLGTCGNSIHK